MSVGRDVSDLLDRLAQTSGQQRVLRTGIVVATVVVLVATSAAGGGFHPLLDLFALLLALLTAVLPESHTGVALLLTLGLYWVVLAPEHLGVWLLVAAAAFGSAHLCTTLAAYGPAGHSLDGVLLRAWARRAGVAFVSTLAVWLLSRGLGFLDLPASRFALGAALLVLLGWVAYLSVRFAAPSEP
jgi:hypothetical protein